LSNGYNTIAGRKSYQAISRGTLVLAQPKKSIENESTGILHVNGVQSAVSGARQMLL
jgi:hypothetical protein